MSGFSIQRVFSVVLVLMLSLTGCSLLSSTDELDGTSWQLSKMAGAQLLTGSTITARFSEGTVGGSSGCNSYGGDYKAKKGKLEIGEVAATEMACEAAGVMDQEQVYLGYLVNAESYEVNTGQLKILTADGVELVFVPE